MDTISISRLKSMTAEEIKEGGCLEVLADGEHVAIVIVGSVGEMKERVEGIAGLIDAGRGR